jgi:hypothetical protein
LAGPEAHTALCSTFLLRSLGAKCQEILWKLKTEKKVKFGPKIMSTGYSGRVWTLFSMKSSLRGSEVQTGLSDILFEEKDPQSVYNGRKQENRD